MFITMHSVPHFAKNTVDWAVVQLSKVKIKVNFSCHLEITVPASGGRVKSFYLFKFFQFFILCYTQMHSILHISKQFSFRAVFPGASLTGRVFDFLLTHCCSVLSTQIQMKDFRFSYKFKMACKEDVLKLCPNIKKK